MNNQTNEKRDSTPVVQIYCKASDREYAEKLAQFDQRSLSSLYNKAMSFYGQHLGILK